MIDPTQPMVVTRTVGKDGRVNLGSEKGGDAGQAPARCLNVGRRLRDQQLDVYFDNGKLSAIAKDHNGRETIVRLGNRHKWTLTGEEFSRLHGVRTTVVPEAVRGVRTTVVPEAVRPAMTDAAENHPGAAMGSDPSEAAGTVIADQRPATPPAHPRRKRSRRR